MPPSDTTAPFAADPVEHDIPIAKPRRKTRARPVDAVALAEADPPAPADAPQSDPKPPRPKRTAKAVVLPEYVLDEEVVDYPGPGPEPEPEPEPTIRVLNAPAVAHVSHDHAALSRLLGAGRYALLPQLGPEALLGVRLAGSVGKEADPYRALVLSGPSGAIELSDGVRLLAALTGIDLGESAVEIADTQWLTAAVLGRLDQTPLRDITAIARGCLAADLQCETVRLSLRSGQHAFAIEARASAACWRDFLARGRWLRDVSAFENYLDLPLTIPVRIGSHALDRASLASLVPGDILLPDTRRFDCSGSGLIRIGGWQLSVSYADPAGLTILSLENRMDPQETNSADADAFVITPLATNHADLGALDTLPLQLHFDMGCCHTTLGSLRTLVAGSVLPIEGGSPGVIAITAGGRTLGQGELVEVNGQLGIRIVHWS